MPLKSPPFFSFIPSSPIRLKKKKKTRLKDFKKKSSFRCHSSSHSPSRKGLQGRENTIIYRVIPPLHLTIHIFSSIPSSPKRLGKKTSSFKRHRPSHSPSRKRLQDRKNSTIIYRVIPALHLTIRIFSSIPSSPKRLGKKTSSFKRHSPSHSPSRKRLQDCKNSTVIYRVIPPLHLITHIFSFIPSSPKRLGKKTSSYKRHTPSHSPSTKTLQL